MIEEEREGFPRLKKKKKKIDVRNLSANSIRHTLKHNIRNNFK